MTLNLAKRKAAEAALDYINFGDVVGVGTGSTANAFIELLGKMKGKIDGTVASSDETKRRLRQLYLPVFDLNQTGPLPLYVDGADEATIHRYLIKGGGGALTREKIVAATSEKFVCIVDHTKIVDFLGTFPLPIEVIPMAQSSVSRALVKKRGQPQLRTGFTTDNGNIIIDALNLDLLNPPAVESDLNDIPGIVCNGIFALRPADVLIVGYEKQTTIYS